MLEAPPAWNDVPDLMMEAEEGRILPKAAVKRKREEVARGRRKKIGMSYSKKMMNSKCRING